MSIVETAMAKRRQGEGPVVTPVAAVPSLSETTGSFTASTRLRGPSMEVRIAELRERGALAPDKYDREISHQFRRIKRGLLRHMNAESDLLSDRCIIVTSALPGDGKTFASTNLGFALALETDRSVLVIDADSYRCSLSKAFGLQDRRGLMDLLVDHTLRPEEVIFDTDVPGLQLMAAGSTEGLPSELIASRRMRDILRWCIVANPARLLLIDTPPVLATTCLLYTSPSPRD